MEKQSTWAEHRMMVVNTLEKLAEDIKEQQKNAKRDNEKMYALLIDIEKKIAVQETKISLMGAVWGAISGFISALLVGGVMWFLGKHN